MRRKLPLSLRILLGLGLGVLAGLALQDAPEFAAAWIQPFGTLFLNLVKMLVVPLVFCSLTAGVGGLGDARHMGRVGGRTLLFYLCTTALAVALGLLAANLFPVGRELGYPLPAAREEAPSFSLADTLLGIVPTNPIQALAEGNMLQILFFALALGWASLTIGEKGAPLLRAFGSLAEAMYALTERTMVLAPVAVFALIAPVVAAEGPRVLSSLLGVAVLVYGACLVQLLLVYGGAVGALARRSPRRFFREALPAVVFAFSSASSAGALPFSLEAAERLGVPRRGALLRPPPGCHPQHGRHRHLPGGVRPVHRQCLRYPPGAPPAAHHHPHLHPGLRRNRRSTRRRGRHAGHGAPVRGPAGGGGGIGPGHRPGAGHGAHRRQRSGRPRLRRCSVRRRTPG